MSGAVGGIASMTRTRVDSAAKHIMPAKVDSNLMKVYCGVENADLQTMHQKRLELLTEKDDLVLNVSRLLACRDTRTFHAYPAVVSTLAKCTDAYRLIVAALFAQRSAADYHAMIAAIGKADKVFAVHDFVTGQAGDGNRAVDAFIAAYPAGAAGLATLRGAGTPAGKALVQELRTMPFYQLQVALCVACVVRAGMLTFVAAGVLAGARVGEPDLRGHGVFGADWRVRDGGERALCDARGAAGAVVLRL